MNRHSTNPWARLRVLLMLPAVALSVTVASASNQDIKSAEKQNNVNTIQIAFERADKPDSVVTINVEPQEAPDDVFMVVENPPEFPGGTQALLDFLRTNINYPAECKENKVQGRVIASFIVEKDGSITDPKIERGVDPALDAEALRVVNMMPSWKPGYQCGEAVRVQYMIPVNFRASKDE